MSSREDGFTVTEMLAALFILSLTAIPLAEITGQMIVDWDQNERRQFALADRVAASEALPHQERRLRPIDAANSVPQSIEQTSVEAFQGQPKITLDAGCEFDLVGRSCR